MSLVPNDRPTTVRIPFGFTVAQMQQTLGNIPVDRILLNPTPGTAVASDVEVIEAAEDRLCELINGTLIEKTMGWYESLLATLLITKLNLFVIENDLGIVLGADGSLNILPGVIRIPDVCFIAKDRMPAQRPPRTPIPNLVPNLVFEILSESNTKAEMDLKLAQYFEAGVECVWYIQPKDKSATRYRSLTDIQCIGRSGTIDEIAALPGFELQLGWLFDQADKMSQ